MTRLDTLIQHLNAVRSATTGMLMLSEPFLDDEDRALLLDAFAIAMKRAASAINEAMAIAAESADEE